MRRQLTVGRVAEAFHVLPSAAARALDEDPEQLDLKCLEVLNYAAIKSAFDKAGNDDKALDHLKDHPYMLAVRRNAFDLHQERRKAYLEQKAQKAQAPPKQRRGEQAQLPDGDVEVAPLKRERRLHGR